VPAAGKEGPTRPCSPTRHTRVVRQVLASSWVPFGKTTAHGTGGPSHAHTSFYGAYPSRRWRLSPHARWHSRPEDCAPALCHAVSPGSKAAHPRSQCLLNAARFARLHEPTGVCLQPRPLTARARTARVAARPSLRPLARRSPPPPGDPPGRCGGARGVRDAARV
jgi:hypothetical protein